MSFPFSRHETIGARGMFLPAMRHETVTVASRTRVDFQGLGYLASIVSVLFLGAIAWPRANDPDWVLPALLAGMATSIVGMGLRYVAHVQQKREIEKAEAEAEARQG